MEEERSCYMDLVYNNADEGNLSSYSQNEIRRVNFKAVSGCERKKLKWGEDLYAVVLAEFERMKGYGMKMSPNVLRAIALALLKSATEGVFPVK